MSRPSNAWRAVLVLAVLVLLAFVNVAAFGYLNGTGFVRDADGHWPLQREPGGLVALAAGDPVEAVRERALYLRLHDDLAGADVVTFTDSPLDVHWLRTLTRVEVAVEDYDARVSGAAAEALARDAEVVWHDKDGVSYGIVADASGAGSGSGGAWWHVSDGDGHYFVEAERARALGIEVGR